MMENRKIIQMLVLIRRYLKENKELEMSDFIRDYLKERYDVNISDIKSEFNHGKSKTKIDIQEYDRIMLHGKL